MTIMLVVVSSYSIMTTFPRLVAVILSPYNSGGAYSISVYFYYIWAVKIIAPWNYCGNFFFYVLSGRQFRDELAFLFSCRERPSGACVSQVVSFMNGQVVV